MLIIIDSQTIYVIQIFNGSPAALPIWVQFMEKVLHNTPEKHWPIPDDIISAEIDPHTGHLAIPGQAHEILF
jgi:penicillin-binding protein 1A